MAAALRRRAGDSQEVTAQPGRKQGPCLAPRRGRLPRPANLDAGLREERGTQPPAPRRRPRPREDGPGLLGDDKHASTLFVLGLLYIF